MASLWVLEVALEKEGATRETTVVTTKIKKERRVAADRDLENSRTFEILREGLKLPIQRLR
jgi:hypothetical protein